ARGNGVLEAERRAYRGDPFADPRFRSVPDPDHREIACVDLDQRDVGAAVHADDLRLEFALVGKLHHDLVRVVDDVRVGQDVAVGAHDETRADPFANRIALGHGNLEAAEEFLDGIARFAGDLGTLHLGAYGRGGGADVDDGVPVLLDQGAEIGERAGGGPLDLLCLDLRCLGLRARYGGQPAALEAQQRRGRTNGQHYGEFLFGHRGLLQ